MRVGPGRPDPSRFVREDGVTIARPTWRLSPVVTAPAAGAALIAVAAVAGQRHRVFGVSLGKEDLVGNAAQLREGATIRTAWSMGSGQADLAWSPTPILVAALATAVSVNVLNAGAAGIDYAAALLVETA